MSLQQISHGPIDWDEKADNIIATVNSIFLSFFVMLFLRWPLMPGPAADQ